MSFDQIDRKFGADPPGADQALLDQISLAPRSVAAMIDRELVKREGLRRFIELAWPTIEKDGTYKPNWHLDAIAEHLEAVSKGQLRRLGIMIPPRHMKSISVAVMWPVWDWIANPERRFLFSSYAHNLSIRDSTRCRRVIQSPWFQERWGDKFRITSDQNTKIRFDNDRGGYRLATSVGGQLTGEGGDIVAVDDPINAEDANSDTIREKTIRWWNESMSTRLNDPVLGAFVLMQQRLHARDLIGYVSDAAEYTFLCLPAEFEPDHPQRWFRDPRKEAGALLWPNHLPRSEINLLKEKLGPYAAAAQLQQRPAPREGGLFKRSWFKIVPVAPDDCINRSRAWDLAATEKKLTKSDPDYTARARMAFSPAAGKFYVEDVERWRESPHRVRELILQTAQNDPKGTKHTIPKDPGQAGVDQASALVAMLAGHDVSAEPQSGDKVTRATPFAGQASGGNVYLVAGPWNEKFLEELTLFPNGAHDDMVDAVASAFNRMMGGTTGIIEYYRQKLAQGDPAKQPPPPPGTTVITNTASEFAAAFFGRPRGQP